MGTHFTEVEDQALKSRSFKVHCSICTGLAELVDKISRIIPAIEANRPGSNGMQVLCSLNKAIDQANSILQRCSDSSTLYLALTSKKLLQNCDILKKKLGKYLGEIRDLVPLELDVQISQLIADLRNAHFRLDSSDEEGGKVLWELLRQGASASDSEELGALQLAASRLHITTHKALSLERRSIRKLLSTVGDSDPRKKVLVKNLMILLNKHRDFILVGGKNNVSARHRMSLPFQLSTSNSLDKRACDPTMGPASPHSDYSSRSIASLSSSMNDFSILSLRSVDSSNVSSSLDIRSASGLSRTSVNAKDFNYSGRSLTKSLERSAEFLSGLSRFPWESQCRIIEEVKSNLEYHDQAFSSLSPENFIEPLLKYIRDAQKCCDVEAQRAGFQLLMEFLSRNRIEISYLHEDACNLVASFLNSEVSEEALSTLELLSDRKYGRLRINASDVIKAIVKFLNSPNRDLQEKAIKLLYILSTRNDVPLDNVSAECIYKLVSCLDDSTLARYCIMTLGKLCDSKVGRLCFAERNDCIESVVKLLDIGSHEVQEQGLALLLSLCSQNDRYCRLAKDASIYSSLFYVSVNGNDRGKAYALELMRLLKE